LQKIHDESDQRRGLMRAFATGLKQAPAGENS